MAGCRPGWVIFGKVGRHRRLALQQRASSKSHISGNTGEAIPELMAPSGINGTRSLFLECGHKRQNDNRQ
jgi:hypothetical protein